MTEAGGFSEFRARLRSFDAAGLAAIVLVLLGIVFSPPIAAVLVLLWVLLSRTPWREIGYVRPGSWVGGLVAGVIFGALLKIAMKAIVLPYLGAPSINSAFHYMTGNPKAVFDFALYAVIGAGWAEETVFRGYVFERLGKALGSGLFPKILTILLSAAFFGALHFQQGLLGIENATIVGAIFGAIFAVSGRLWFLMVAHAAFDLTAAAMIYFDLENWFAHLIFH